MADLVGFLRARIDADEAAARAATEDPGMSAEWYEQTSGCLDIGLPNHGGQDWTDYVWPQGDSRVTRYIARWDPARVLAEVAAKRQLVRLFSDRPTAPPASDVFLSAMAASVTSTNDWVLRQMVQPYADHPDFDPTWRDAP
jgi:hypothetical protein